LPTRIKKGKTSEKYWSRRQGGIAEAEKPDGQPNGSEKKSRNGIRKTKLKFGRLERARSVCGDTRIDDARRRREDRVFGGERGEEVLLELNTQLISGRKPQILLMSAFKRQCLTRSPKERLGINATGVTARPAGEKKNPESAVLTSNQTYPRALVAARTGSLAQKLRIREVSKRNKAGKNRESTY